MHRRVVLPLSAEPLPLQLESIGVCSEQEQVERPQGYPWYHWLQTAEGEGRFEWKGAVWRLPERTGVLLPPHAPHRYRAVTPVWQTSYITFGGSLAASLCATLQWTGPERFQWEEREEPELKEALMSMLERAESGTDPSGWSGSAELYRFLTLLKTKARTDHRPSMHRRLERVRTLLDWLDTEHPNPALGLKDMAQLLGIGERQLNDRFRELFGQTAYAYLIHLRLRKAKERLVSTPDRSVRQIAESVGFRDASHFVATFRSKEGMTPETYRKLHGTVRDHRPD